MKQKEGPTVGSLEGLGRVGVSFECDFARIILPKLAGAVIEEADVMALAIVVAAVAQLQVVDSRCAALAHQLLNRLADVIALKREAFLREAQDVLIDRAFARATAAEAAEAGA